MRLWIFETETLSLMLSDAHRVAEKNRNRDRAVYEAANEMRYALNMELMSRGVLPMVDPNLPSVP